MTIHDLYGVFPGASGPPEHVELAAEEIPQPYRQLLAHEDHMTVTMEAHHRKPVYVRVLQRHRAGSWYARKILLFPVGTEKVVQFGIVRINLDLCSKEVRRAILDEATPLGRILIRHNVHRRIQPTAYLRLTPDDELQRCFRLTEPIPAYGRLAIIHCDGQPAVELLEIPAPEADRGQESGIRSQESGVRHQDN
jgi:chorismate-pyruvate lyase